MALFGVISVPNCEEKPGLGWNKGLKWVPVAAGVAVAGMDGGIGGRERRTSRAGAPLRPAHHVAVGVWSPAEVTAGSNRPGRPGTGPYWVMIVTLSGGDLF